MGDSVVVEEAATILNKPTAYGKHLMPINQDNLSAVQELIQIFMKSEFIADQANVSNWLEICKNPATVCKSDSDMSPVCFVYCCFSQSLIESGSIVQNSSSS